LRILSRFRNKLIQAYFDIRVGVYTGGIQGSRYAASGANDTVSTDLRIIPALLDQALSEGDVFVDVGCGRGRVLHWVLRDERASAVYGIELDKRVAAIAARSLDNYLNATVVAGNVLTALPDDATLMYLWNPFNADMMEKFKEAVVTKYTSLGRLNQLRIVYHNALHSKVFEDDGACRVTPILLPAWEHHRAILVTFR
jgi:SAM-dependent methyltransferase